MTYYTLDYTSNIVTCMYDIQSNGLHVMISSPNKHIVFYIPIAYPFV